jgi:hypothetical protein
MKHETSNKQPAMTNAKQNISTGYKLNTAPMKQKASNLFLINVKPNTMPMEQKAGSYNPR